MPNPKTPWYHKGLRFSCTQCGACCTGAPGVVWVSDDEVTAIANHLGVSEAEFIKRYTRRVHGKLSLIEDPKNYDCVFLKDKKCSLYHVRPKQCRTFPFWKHALASKEGWQDLKSYCEGIDHPDAPLISLSEIQSRMNE